MANDKSYRQIEIKHGSTTAIINVIDDPRLKVGNRITLKNHPYGPQPLWFIKWVATHTTSQKPRIDWEVGGIQ